MTEGTIEPESTSAGPIRIVEDERVVAFDLQQTLTRLGYSIVGSVASAQEAIDSAIGCRPDLVLMDTHLKGTVDGIEAATQIHKLADIPIIWAESSPAQGVTFFFTLANSVPA